MPEPAPAPWTPEHPWSPDRVVRPASSVTPISDAPEHASAYSGLEVVPSQLPETVASPQNDKETAGVETVNGKLQSSDDGSGSFSREKRKLHKWCWILALAAVIIIVVAVTVPVVLSRRRQTNDDSPLALRGSRLASIRSLYTEGSLFLIYQTRNGSIAYAASSSPGNWEKSKIIDISDAMDKTPLATSYELSDASNAIVRDLLVTWWS